MESRAIPGGAYAPLLSPAADPQAQQNHHSRRWRACATVLAASAVVALVVVASTLVVTRTMGPADGVAVDEDADAAGGFPWSNEMLQWQRAGFHFQPEGNFMSGTSQRMRNGIIIDFYPVGGGNSSEVLHVIKASMDDERHDYYSLGRYDAAANTWTPIDPELDLGIGLRYDWGKLYASTSFYDPSKQRRIMLGYVGETDSARADVAKGWASIQSIPRTVALDEKTRTNLLLWPVEEIEALRFNATELSDITVDTGSVFHIPLHQSTQLDIEASFHLDASSVATVNEAEVGYNCSSSGGAAARGALGPFGLLIHAAGDRHGEQTAVYFYVSRALDGSLKTSFCNDESRSSRARDVVTRVVGSSVPVLDGEALSMRILVDHSIVQSFAMGGRSTVTSRVYPTEAIYANVGVYLFNNATSTGVTAEKVVVHEMDTAAYNEKLLAEDL